MSSMKNASNAKNTSSVMSVPCREWAEKLAAAHPADLPLSERAALNQHVATCAACAAVRDEYRSMDAFILELPTVAPLPASMIQLERLEEASKERDETFSIPMKPGSAGSRKRLSRAGKMLSSLAAVLVVGVIVGSFVLLFSMNRADNTTISGDVVSSSSASIYVATDVAKSVAYAINPVNGAIIWKHMLGYKLTGPAIVVQKLVIFASYNGFIYAYHTSDGALAWKTHVGSGDNAAPSLTPSNGSSEAVYFSTSAGSFGALRIKNGTILWQKHLSTCTQNCDEFGVQVANGVYYVFANGLYALNASNGNGIWQNLDLKLSLSFAVTSGKVFVLKSQRPGATKQNPSNILVLNASDGHQIGTIQGSDFASGNGILYVENINGTWYAMRVSDGSILWRSKTAGCGSSLSGNTIYSAINVLEAGKNGQSGYSEICAMSTSDGRIRWDWKTSTLEMVATPVELNGVAYYEHNTALEARRVSDGKVLWRVPFTSILQGPTIG